MSLLPPAPPLLEAATRAAKHFERLLLDGTSTRFRFGFIVGFIHARPRLARRLQVIATKGFTRMDPNAIPAAGSFAEAVVVPLDENNLPTGAENLVATIADPTYADVGMEGFTLRILPKQVPSPVDPATGERIPVTIQVRGDAIVGEGEAMIVGSIDVTFVPGQATHFGIGPLTIKPNPPAAPPA